MKNFIKDNSQFTTSDFEKMKSFIEAEESPDNQKWITDEDALRTQDIRFMPIMPEPITIASQMASLSSSSWLRFTASSEAYSDTMNCAEYGFNGSSQLMVVKGDLYPVGNSAIQGILQRAGIKIDGFRKLVEYNPRDLSEVLNRFFKASKGNLCVLIQDEKVRAVNSGRYGICPVSFVVEQTEKWIREQFPKATVSHCYACHDFVRWIIDLSAYTADILAAYPGLMAMGCSPAVEVTTSHTGNSSVQIKPAFIISGLFAPLGNTIDCPHLGRGSRTERTEQIKQKVANNFQKIFVSLDEAIKEIDNLSKVPVTNAYNALLRAMKSLGMPKEQGMEAAEQFEFLYGEKPATAQDCCLAILDAYTFIVRDNPGNEKKAIEAADMFARSIKLNWKRLGNIPGSFSW